MSVLCCYSGVHVVCCSMLGVLPVYGPVLRAILLLVRPFKVTLLVLFFLSCSTVSGIKQVFIKPCVHQGLPLCLPLWQDTTFLYHSQVSWSQWKSLQVKAVGYFY